VSSEINLRINCQLLGDSRDTLLHTPGKDISRRIYSLSTDLSFVLPQQVGDRGPTLQYEVRSHKKYQPPPLPTETTELAPTIWPADLMSLQDAFRCN